MKKEALEHTQVHAQGHTQDHIILPIHSDSDVVRLGQKTQIDELKRVIRSMNLKITDQRLLILQCLFESNQKKGERHVTAQELFEKVSERDNSLGFATVYRFLRELADNKVVTEVRVGGHPSRYELTPREHHDHLTCTKCGMICEFENEKIESLQEQVAAHFGFQLTGHVLELYGVCPTCQKK